MSVEDYITAKISAAFVEVEEMIPEMELTPDQQASFRENMRQARGVTCSCAAGAIARATLDTKRVVPG